MKKLLIATVIGATVLNMSCKKDPEDAPTIPPADTFEMDFSDFNDGGKSAIDTTKRDHWGRAAIQVGVWQLILAGNLAIPVLSFKEAFNHTPSYVSKKEGWLWEYTVQNWTGTYTCKLYGKLNTSTTDWRMLISKSGSFTDVEWYTGTSQNDKSAGTWSLNKDALNVTPYLGIDWSKSGTVKTIKYTNINTGASGYGSYITHTVDSSKTLDANYVIHDVANNYKVDINWSRATKEGYSNEPGHYLDNDNRCWDSNLKNKVCN